MSKVLIADSGSTKTDWVLLKKEKVHLEFKTEGLNPMTGSGGSLEAKLKESFSSEAKQPDILHFYGAGCRTEKGVLRIKEAIKNQVEPGKTHIYHDLLGAARSLCGKQKGIAVILGTGSNACSYDGQNITEERGGWGYVLSDEGSGFQLGKTLLLSYLNGDLPEEIKNDFIQHFGEGKEKFIEKIYQEEEPNQYLASFAPFVAKWQENAVMKDLVLQEFSNLFEKAIIPLKKNLNSPINFTGSIAHYFEDQLRSAAGLSHCKINKISRSPLSGLVDYHQPQDPGS